MRQFFNEFRSFFRKGDMILLCLCLILTAFGCMVIASAANVLGSTRYVLIQLLATALGVLMYAIVSSVDVDFFSEQRIPMTLIGVFMLLLLIPFGKEVNGNKSWLDFPPAAHRHPAR